MLPLEIPFLDGWAASPHSRITAEPFNHWNKEGMVPPACAKCNSTYGFRDFIGDDGSTPGKIDDDEAVYANGYKGWTPRLPRAAYNYRYVAKDPGAYTHNPGYVIQLLHDSLADLARKVPVEMAGKARPE